MAVWSWAWMRELMVFGALIVGAQYEGVRVEAAIMCVLIWHYANVLMSRWGEKMKNRALRDFMIRRYALHRDPTAVALPAEDWDELLPQKEKGFVVYRDGAYVDSITGKLI